MLEYCNNFINNTNNNRVLKKFLRISKNKDKTSRKYLKFYNFNK